MKQRDYQIKAEDRTLELYGQGKRSLLGVLPTGCGKTVVFAFLIRAMTGRRTIVVAHRKELIEQAAQKIAAITGLRVEIEMGEQRANIDQELFLPQADVVVSSIQTLTSGTGGRLAKFNPLDYGFLVMDEVHHGLAPSWRTVLEHFRQNEDLRVLGVTATPRRSDGFALGAIFEETAFDYELHQAIKDGWLVPIHQQFVNVPTLDFTNVNTRLGDLANSELDALMKAEKPLHGVAYPTLDLLGDRRGLGFASSVEHARMLTEIFNRHKPGCAAFVHGGMRDDERIKVIKYFRSGKLSFIWNFGVLTEGFDVSEIDLISMGRPTKSIVLYTQMLGRGTRPHDLIQRRLGQYNAPGMRKGLIASSFKPNCLVLDFVGNSGKHKIVSVGDVLGGKWSQRAITQAKFLALKSGKRVDMIESIEEQEANIESAKVERVRQEIRRSKIVVKASYTLQDVDPFDAADVRPIAEIKLKAGYAHSPGMRKMILQMKLNPDKITVEQAKNLVGQHMARWKKGKCTVSQQSVLVRLGWNDAECGKMTKDQAKANIDSAKRNGWKRPTKLTLETEHGVLINPEDPY